DEGEKQLFRRMAVFQGGRTLEGLEAVCNPGVRGEGLGVSAPGQTLTPRPSPLTPLEVDVLEGVESLVSNSLLQQRESSDGEPRLWMLETIHEYAREKLAESGEAEALEREHAHYFMKLAEEAEREFAGARRQEWLHRLEDANDNLRAALRWARESGTPDAAETGLRIAGALWKFWSIRGDVSEGRAQVEGA